MGRRGDGRREGGRGKKRKDTEKGPGGKGKERGDALKTSRRGEREMGGGGCRHTLEQVGKRHDLSVPKGTSRMR